MEYTEEKANEIIANFGLQKKIKATWKRRGSIPNRYLEPKKEQNLIEPLRNSLRHRAWRMSAFDGCFGGMNTANETIKKQKKASANKIHCCKKMIDSTLYLVKSCIEEFDEGEFCHTFKSLVACKTLKKAVLLSTQFSKEEIKRISYLLATDKLLEPAQIEKIKICLRELF